MFAIVICLVLLTIYVLCVLMVENISVVVNFMLSLTSVISPPPDLGSKVMIFGGFALMVSLVT